jgi:hypothetical protein
MTSTTIYDLVNNLPTLTFVGGTDKSLIFTCYEENGLDLLNITSGTVKWLLCPYGQFSVVTLELSTDTSGVTITDANHFTVTLDGADTYALSGKYIQQVDITDFDGKQFRPGQGFVLISPAIQS